MRDRRRLHWVSACATAALLVAVGVEAHARAKTRPAALSVVRDVRRTAADAFPYSVGEWLGRDVEATPAAVALLRPGVLVNRAYDNLRTGEAASLLFVWCDDARDLLGHYPPICYPARGNPLTASRPRDWQLGPRAITGTRYRFRGNAEQTHLGAPEPAFVVDNFMVLPTGGYGRDMASVDRVAQDPHLRGAGAAEVQVVTSAAMSDARRDAVFAELLAPAAALLDRITSRPPEAPRHVPDDPR